MARERVFSLWVSANTTSLIQLPSFFIQALFNSMDKVEIESRIQKQLRLSIDRDKSESAHSNSEVVPCPVRLFERFSPLTKHL